TNGGVTMRNELLFLLVVSSILGATSCATAPSPVLPANFQWVDSQVLPGAKVAILAGNPARPGFSMWRSSFPANYQVPAHHHSVTEYVTVISGTIYNGGGEKLDIAQGTAYPAGSFFVNPAN